jgi:hypothetical protein
MQGRFLGNIPFWECRYPTRDPDMSFWGRCLDTGFAVASRLRTDLGLGQTMACSKLGDAVAAVQREGADKGQA